MNERIKLAPEDDENAMGSMVNNFTVMSPRVTGGMQVSPATAAAKEKQSEHKIIQVCLLVML